MTTMTREEATAKGRKVLWRNAAAAIAVGAALIALPLFTWRRWAVGLLVGLLYSNVFEYCYHRFLLHRASRFAPGHARHHQTWGTDEEGLHANFGDSPVSVTLLLITNAIPFLLLEWLFGLGIGAGVVMGFVVYLVGMEEIHWRIHMGGLPRFLERSRRHHFDHHSGRSENYNVFLPLCDWLVPGVHGPRGGLSATGAPPPGSSSVAVPATRHLASPQATKRRRASLP